MIKTLIWTTKKENLEAYGIEDANNASIFLSDVKNTTFKELIKEYKKTETNRILKIKDDLSFEIIFKRNSVWTTLKFEDLVSSLLISNDLKVLNNDIYVPNELKSGSRDSNINYPFDIKKDFDGFKEILKLTLDDYMFVNFEKKLNGKTFSTNNQTFYLKDKVTYENFIRDILIKNLQGIQKISSSLEGDKLKIVTKFGEIYTFINNEEQIQILSFLKTDNKRMAELFNFSKGIIINIKNHIVQSTMTTNIPKKIKRKDIITWVLSLLVVSVLLYSTFNFIFSPHNLNTSIKILFSGYSWLHPWMYLMMINFFISLFIGPIIGILIFKATKPKEKIKWTNYANFFISGQIRLVTVFLTGNSILATILWAWYLTSTTKIRTVGLVGMIASISILRGILLLPIGSFFMIRGTIFNSMIFGELGMTDESIAILALSWIGWIWHIIHNLSISLLIVLPPLHILWNKITIFRYRNEKDTDLIINKMNIFEMNLITLKHSFKDIFKNKERFWRIILIIFLNIIVETFEFTFGLKIVEGYAINNNLIQEAGHYWNILAISSVRYMSGFVYHVPIINLLPGQGTGITDLTLKLSTEGVIGHAHNWENLSNDQISDLGEQTTFLMRFFNFYLRRVIALVITTFIVGKILLNKKEK